MLERLRAVVVHGCGPTVKSGRHAAMHSKLAAKGGTLWQLSKRAACAPSLAGAVAGFCKHSLPASDVRHIKLHQLCWCAPTHNPGNFLEYFTKNMQGGFPSHCIPVMACALQAVCDWLP
jgi:hypothetical protein